MKPKAINPKETTRSEAFELWMSAPNPMVTFFKQINVTNLVRISKKYKLKFNIHTIEYCMYIQRMIVLCRRSLQSILMQVAANIQKWRNNHEN